jgi:hypothetical protein
MKLSIGINIFGSFKRQDQCIDVLNKLASKYIEIELYNITYETDINYSLGFKHLPVLKRKAKDLIFGSTSEKPIVSDFFNVLADTNCDYFIFLNSDVLLTEKLLKLVLKGEYETYFFSRHDCYPIDDLNKIIPFRIEIAGFDAWAVKKSWWIENRTYFKDYIYAEHLWDVAYAVEMFNRSKSFFGNKDVYLCHEKHDLNWTETSPEAIHNSNLWKETPYHERWKEFIYSYLVRRQPFGRFLHPLSDESEKEIEYLKIKK